MALSQLDVPVHWQRIDFVSDLHLQQADATWQCFINYLQKTPADAVFLLGDILELWAGDDTLQDAQHTFECQFVEHLHAISQHKSLYFMHGNRDFLVGQDFCQKAGLTLLNDPCVVSFALSEAPLRILLSHGDALCVDDTAYMQLRATVRNPVWQQHFLQQPLEHRLQQAHQLRQQSSMRKALSGKESYADVDADLAVEWLQAKECSVLLHGHTHKPGEHVLPGSLGNHALHRWVLSDWEMSATPVRGDIVRLHRLQNQTVKWERVRADEFLVSGH